MPARTLIVIATTVLLTGVSASMGVSQASPSSRPAQAAGHIFVGSSTRKTRPDRADWEKIKAAARTRRIALEPHRTAHFRAFAGYLGLSELVTIHPLAPGRCATAVIYLYNNLLDLENAYPGESWGPLRRLVAREPSIRACGPRRVNRRTLTW